MKKSFNVCAVGALLLLTLAMVIPAGCASVKVRKIGADGKPEGPDGIRFYRPRPYVSVHEPFVIAARPYVAAGRMTPDGRFVVIENVPAELSGRIALVNGQVAVAASHVLVGPGGPPTGGGVQSGEVNVDDKTVPKPDPKDSKDPAEPKPTGQLDLRVTNNTGVWATQPTRRYFDIQFLPDFEEDYVVEVESNFGNASADVALGQGWSLQGMSATLDNSAITDRLLTVFDETFKVLSAAAKAALGIPPVVGGGVQSGDVTTADRTFAGGTPVSIKITLIRVAVPGLYPILKPKELREFNAAAAATIDPFYRDRILVPIAPLTNIAFNTYEVMVIEAATVAGDSALRVNQSLSVSFGNAAGAVSGGGGGEDARVRQVEAQLNAAFAERSIEITLTINPQDRRVVDVTVTAKPGGTVTDPIRTEAVNKANDSLAPDFTARLK